MKIMLEDFIGNNNLYDKSNLNCFFGHFQIYDKDGPDQFHQVIF
jgi:hypothetical protein